ncbi:hypothetical protein KR49_10350 [Synechococcus sp. KORDI-49]|jgi:hypothetical protein|nr:hypothetical protein KR49_10350 [Synechococcus sp. KORDI-49]
MPILIRSSRASRTAEARIITSVRRCSRITYSPSTITISSVTTRLITRLDAISIDT